MATRILFFAFSVLFFLGTQNAAAQVAGITFKGTPSIVVEAARGANSAIVNYDNPAAQSSCPGGKTVVSLTKGPVSGTAFQIGTTELTFVASDTCGNEATFKMRVTVKSAESAIKARGPERASGSTKKLDVQLLPNPASSFIRADLSPWDGQALNINLLNTSGAAVHSASVTGSVDPIAFDLIGLPEGVYVMQIAAADNSVSSRQVLVQR